jgi:hypothetical protein
MILKFKRYYQEADDEDIVFTCSKFKLTVEQTDLDASDDGAVYWTFSNCSDGEIQVRKHTFAGNYVRCVSPDSTPIAYIISGGNVDTSIDSTVTNLLESC